jgi:DNA-binding NtrC family response regulator
MKRILIVEDEPKLRLLYQQEFETDGYRVISAADAEAALQHLEKGGADLVVLDLSLPGKSGLELLRDLVARRHDLPVVINTAYSFYRDNFSTWGAEAFLVKSGDLTELKETVSRLVGMGSETPDEHFNSLMLI